MGVERRTVLIAAGMLLTAGCARAAKRKEKPVAPSPEWLAYKSRFLDASGRIVDTGNGGVSHSEGQGYGLAMAFWNGDRDAFARIFAWTEQVLTNEDTGLYAWRYDPNQPDPVSDRNNATDGDIFIAWILEEAGQRWEEPAYGRRAAALRAAILTHLVVERDGRAVLLPGLQGFDTPAAVTLNPSYYVWPALDAFAKHDASWTKVIADGEALLKAARFGPLALPTDWIDMSGHDRVAPATGRPARFGFDAVRVPLYALAGKRMVLLPPIRAFWQGYATSGKPIPAWVDVLSGEVAPYPLSDGGAAIARAMGIKATGGDADDYYAASLKMLARHLL